MQLADALIKANKDFDMLIYPGRGHCIGTPYFTRKQWDYFVTHLHGTVPPKEYKMTLSGSGKSSDITIRNSHTAAIDIYWVEDSGNLKKYYTIKPGEEQALSSYTGHDWQARAEGVAFSTYTVNAEKSLWDVTREEREITIHNKTGKQVEVVWLPADGNAVTYHTIGVGGSVTQHSYAGHNWEARIAGKTVSAYSVSVNLPVWTIK